MDNIVERLQSLFPQQFDIIVGSLLGDARLECRSVGARAPITARLRIHHGDKQREYVWWKYEQLKEFVVTPPKQITWVNPKRNLTEVSWYFHTRSIREFGILYQYFYDREKILPLYIEKMLSPQALAVWFMDDGSRTESGGTISTHSFIKDDQYRILAFLKEKYGIRVSVVKDRTQWKIALNQLAFAQLVSTIKPFIIPSMAYKIADPRNDLLVRQLANGGAEGNTFANMSVPTLEKSGKV